MISTGLNHFFQNINNEVLHILSEFMSMLNHDVFFFLIFLAIVFGLDFKRGFLLVHAFFWTFTATYFLKSILNLPRPIDIDPNLRTPGLDINHIQPENTPNGPVKLTAKNISFARDHFIASGGLPSAIMAKASIFWLSLWELFKQKWIILSGLLICFLTAISALYMGHNFGVDLVAGFAIGLIVYFLIFHIMYRGNILEKFASKPRHGFVRPWKASGRILYLFIIPSLLLLFPQADVNLIAKLIGFNLAYYIIGIRRWPKNGGTTYQRMLRVLIVIVVFILTNFITAQFIVQDYSMKYFITNLFEMYFSIHLSVTICRKFKLYKG